MTVCSVYSVRRSQVPKLLLVVIAVTAMDRLFESGLYAVGSSDGEYTWNWAGLVDESMLFGSPWLWVTDSLNAVVVAPIVEEILFRGVLYKALRSRLSVIQAAVVSAIVFAGAHGYSLTGFFAVMSAGFLWALLYEYTRSLAACALAHGVNNLAAALFPLQYLLV